MEKYRAPEVEYVKVDNEDVIKTSSLVLPEMPFGKTTTPISDYNQNQEVGYNG